MRIATALLLSFACSTPQLVRAGDATTQPLSPPKQWKLAFVRDNNVWTANGDGKGQKLVIENGGAPCWSPDKTRIAFQRGGNIWTANADGTGQRQLTFRWKTAETHSWKAWRHRPVDITWDPQENLITFSHWDVWSLTRSGNARGTTVSIGSIYDVPSTATKDADTRVRLDLSESLWLYQVSNFDHPAWSHSGKALAFVRDGDIWLTDRQPGELRGRGSWWCGILRVTEMAEEDQPIRHGSNWTIFVTHISWSPDDKMLAFCYKRLHGSGIEEVFVLNVEKYLGWIVARAVAEKNPDDVLWESGDRDSEPAPVKGDHLKPAIDLGMNPCFSPDGKWIVYQDWEGIWVCTTDGRNQQQIVESGEQPAW